MCNEGLSSKVTLIAYPTDAYYVFYLYQSITCSQKYTESIYLRVIVKHSYSGLAKTVIFKLQFLVFLENSIIVSSENNIEYLY